MILKAEGLSIPIKSLTVKSPNALKIAGEGSITLATIDAVITFPNGMKLPVAELFDSNLINKGWSVEAE